MLPGIGVSGWGSCDRGERGCLTCRGAVPDHPRSRHRTWYPLLRFPMCSGRKVRKVLRPLCCHAASPALRRGWREPCCRQHPRNRTREEKRERARGASGVPQARLVRVFLAAKGASQAGHPLAISCLIPLVNASNNAIDEQPRNWRGWDHGFKRPPRLLLSLPSPPPASAPCFCGTLAPQTRWSSQAQQLGFVEPFPASQGARVHPGPHAVPNWPASVDGSSQSCPQT